MKISLFITIAGVAMAFATGLLADDPLASVEKLPLPAGPLLRKMGGAAAWRINYTYPEDSDKSASRKSRPRPSQNGSVLPSAPRSVTVTRLKADWDAVTVDVEGHTMEVCSDGENKLILASTKPVPTLAPQDLNGHLSANLIDFTQVDFPEMGWIGSETYLGVQKIASVSYLVFTKAGPEGATTVWVNAETRFPFLWKQGLETRTFEQLPDPAGFPILSPPLAKLSESLQQDRARLHRPIPRGG